MTEERPGFDMRRVGSTGNEKVDLALDRLLKAFSESINKVKDAGTPDEVFEKLLEEAVKTARKKHKVRAVAVNIALGLIADQVKDESGFTEDEKNLFMQSFSKIMGGFLQQSAEEIERYRRM